MVSGGCSHSWRIASSWQQFAMWKVRGCRIRRAERSLSRLRRYGRSGAGHSTFKIRSTRGLSEPRKRFEGQRQRFALQAYPETMTRNVESPAMRPSPEQRASPRGVTRLVRSMNMAGVCRNGRRPAQRRRRLARSLQGWPPLRKPVRAHNARALIGIDPQAPAHRQAGCTCRRAATLAVKPTAIDPDHRSGSSARAARSDWRAPRRIPCTKGWPAV